MYDETNELQKNWKDKLPRYSDAELRSIFPEYKELLQEQIAEAEKVEKYLTAIIKFDLMQILRTTTNPMTRWFFRQWVVVTLGEELAQVQQNIRRMQKLLRPEIIKQDSISAEKIAQAKSVPIETQIPSSQRSWNGRTRALCPFHDDTRPSMVIYQKNNRYWCFVCNDGGDVINFIQKKNSLSFTAAVKELIK